jgi:catechol 2,3-dioxygenase-like lactoylglutathione lyase family enzyme
MLGEMNATASVAVKDLERAGKFYGETLGLKRAAGGDSEVMVFQSGATKVNVYRSQYAGTNKATALVWSVGDNIESIVKDLKAKGVVFEHYDIPQLKAQGDVYVNDRMKTAWFKDPDGNILNLINV